MNSILLVTDGDHTPEIIRQTCEVLTNVELRTTLKNGWSKGRKLKTIFAVHGGGESDRKQKQERWCKRKPDEKSGEVFSIGGYWTG